MPTAYAPGLLVTRHTTIRKFRRLPIKRADTGSAPTKARGRMFRGNVGEDLVSSLWFSNELC